MATTSETPPTTSAVSAQKAAIAGGRSNAQTNLEHLTILKCFSSSGLIPKPASRARRRRSGLTNTGPTMGSRRSFPEAPETKELEEADKSR
jgi:hypothetical protein